MATWITPKTSWTRDSYMTYTDVNRIVGNIAYLYDMATDAGYTVSGTKLDDTPWTQNDIITAEFWQTVIDSLKNIEAAIGYAGDSLYTRFFYYYINRIEQQSLACYQIIEVSAAAYRLNHWVGDPLYCGNTPQFYTGGRY